MSYKMSIYQYISATPRGKIICTRQVLHLGTRAAVDQAMYRMVKSKVLIRLARGVFIRAGSKIPSAVAIAKAKAKAFGRSLTSHGEALADTMGLATKLFPRPRYANSAGTSSFGSIQGRTFFASKCDRKRHLKETEEGQTIRAFWHLGKAHFQAIARHIPRLLKPDLIEKIALQAAWMPYWMSDEFYELT